MFIKKITLFDRILIPATLALAFVYSLRRLGDTDLWGHLKCGEYLFAKGAILKTHLFNCSWPDFPYLNHEWLFQAIIYLIHRAGGEAGLVALQVLLVVASFTLLYLILRLYTKNVLLISGVLALGIMASSHRYDLRPQHFTYLFLVYFLYSLHQYQRGRQRYAWFMPLIMVVWVNMHAESLWGIVIPVTFLAVEFAKTLAHRGEGRGRLKPLALIVGLLVVAAGINPFGYTTIIWPLIVMKEQFGGVEELLSPITMRYALFWLYFLLFLLSTGAHLKRTDPTWLVLSVMFAVVAWSANRGIPHFVFLSAPGVAANLDSLALRLRWTAPAGAVVAFKAALLTGILALMLFAVTAPSYLQQYDGVPYPVGAIGFLQANHIAGNVFNAHRWGGYILWTSYPELKPYIDGRFFYKRFYDEYVHLQSAGGGWNEIFSSYGIRIAILEYSTTDQGTLTDRLFSSLGWRLVYWDDVALVYLKDTPENKQTIARFGNDIINPDRQLLYGYDGRSADFIGQAAAITDQNLRFAGSSYKALILSGNALFAGANYAAAAQRYESALPAISEGHAWLFYRLALCYRQLGDRNKTMRYLEQVIRLAPEADVAKQMLRSIQVRQSL